jgi:hypothetical protein
MRNRRVGRGSDGQSLASFLATHDAFDVLATLALVGGFGYRASGGKAVEPLAGFVIEHAQALALRSAGRAARAADRGRSGEIAKLVSAAELATASAFRVSNDEARDATGDLWEARLRLRLWQRGGYDPGPADMELERVTSLFDDFAVPLDAALGFTPREAVAIVWAFNALTAVGVAHFFGIAPQLLSDPVLLAERLSGDIASGKILRTIPRGISVDVSFNTTMLEFYASHMAREEFPGVEIRRSAVEAFVDRFSWGFGDFPASQDPFRDLWKVRDKPLVRDTRTGLTMLPVSYNLAHAVAPAFEEALRSVGGLTAEGFSKAKARHIEEEAIAPLARFARPDGVWRSLSYIPADKSQRAEGDGLIRVDSLFIAVEAKAVELSQSARMGDARAVTGKLQAAILDGAKQAERTISAMRSRVTITGVTPKGKREEIAFVDGADFLPLVVTLESLGAVTAGVSKVIDDAGAAVVALNVDDLRWFAEQCSLPAELLYYLVLRRRMATDSAAAFDEADWFWLYRSLGARAFSERVELYRQYEFSMVIGTHERRGRDVEPAEQPLLTLLEALDKARPAGWLGASFALLDRDLDEATEIAAWLRRRTAAKQPSSRTLVPSGADAPEIDLIVGGASELRNHPRLNLCVDFDLQGVEILG